MVATPPATVTVRAPPGSPLMVTEPVGGKAASPAAFTVIVNVTGCPAVATLSEGTIDTDVATGVGVEGVVGVGSGTGVGVGAIGAGAGGGTATVASFSVMLSTADAGMPSAAAPPGLLRVTLSVSFSSR